MVSAGGRFPDGTACDPVINNVCRKGAHRCGLDVRPVRLRDGRITPGPQRVCGRAGRSIHVPEVLATRRPSRTSPDGLGRPTVPGRQIRGSTGWARPDAPELPADVGLHPKWLRVMSREVACR